MPILVVGKRVYKRKASLVRFRRALVTLTLVLNISRVVGTHYRHSQQKLGPQVGSKAASQLNN